jgi:hypothetical protein
MKNKSVILSVILSLFVIFGLVYASPRLAKHTTKTSRNEGNARNGIAIQVSSTTWTQVLSRKPDRRAALLHTLSTAGDTICISTITASGTLCTATTPGVRIEAGGTYSDYSEQALYGRTASSSVYVYGLDYYDSRDGGFE